MDILDPFWCHHHLPSSWSPLVWQLWRPPLNLFRSPSWQSPSPLLSWSWLSWLSWLPLVWQLWKANSSFSVIIPGFSGASGKTRFSSTWGDTMNFHYWILPTRDLKIKTINNHELHQHCCINSSLFCALTAAMWRLWMCWRRLGFFCLAIILITIIIKHPDITITLIIIISFPELEIRWFPPTSILRLASTVPHSPTCPWPTATFSNQLISRCLV